MGIVAIQRLFQPLLTLFVRPRDYRGGCQNVSVAIFARKPRAIRRSRVWAGLEYSRYRVTLRSKQDTINKRPLDVHTPVCHPVQLTVWR
jgi:hypothetical protein